MARKKAKRTPWDDLTAEEQQVLNLAVRTRAIGPHAAWQVEHMTDAEYILPQIMSGYRPVRLTDAYAVALRDFLARRTAVPPGQPDRAG